MNQLIAWSPGMTVRNVIREVVTRGLAHYRHKTTTANALGISVRTLSNWLEEWEEEDRIAKELDEQQQERDRIFSLRARGIYTAPDSTVVVIEPETEVQVTNLRMKRG